MQDLLEIPVTYKNEELSFNAQVKQFGYISHIVVDMYGTALTIERDEEGNFRVLGNPDEISSGKIDLELVKAMVEVLENL